MIVLGRFSGAKKKEENLAKTIKLFLGYRVLHLITVCTLFCSLKEMKKSIRVTIMVKGLNLE